VSPATAVEDKYDSPDFQKSLQSTAEHVDNHVGQRLRLRRQELSQSQTAVADRLEVTFQQVQKYERGMNRISASRLHDLCGILNVPVEYFFEGLEADVVDPDGPDLNDRELTELVNHYMLIPRQVTRARLSAMLRAVGRWVV
jgi:transcriptional regulator with XRE-family HTH domain